MLTPETGAKRRVIFERLNQVSGVINSLKNEVLAGNYDHMTEMQFEALTDWFNEMLNGFRHGAMREKASQEINEQFDRIRQQKEGW